MWMLRHILHRIAVFQISLLLFLLYVAVVVPLGFIERLFMQAPKSATWSDFKLKYQQLSDLEQQ